jgi:hypothetical protein
MNSNLDFPHSWFLMMSLELNTGCSYTSRLHATKQISKHQCWSLGSVQILVIRTRNEKHLYVQYKRAAKPLRNQGPIHSKAGKTAKHGLHLVLPNGMVLIPEKSWVQPQVRNLSPCFSSVKSYAALNNTQDPTARLFFPHQRCVGRYASKDSLRIYHSNQDLHSAQHSIWSLRRTSMWAPFPARYPFFPAVFGRTPHPDKHKPLG